MKYIKKPFLVVTKNPVTVFSWFICVFIVGQVGIITSIISNWKFLEFGSLILNFNIGNFYIFTIACLSYGLFEYVNEYYVKKESRFKGIKIVSGTLSLVLIGLILMLCSSSILPVDKTIKELSHINNVYELVWQIVLYILSLLTSLYVFCVSKMDNWYEDFKDIDDKNVNNLGNRVSKANITEEGVEI